MDKTRINFEIIMKAKSPKGKSQEEIQSASQQRRVIEVLIILSMMLFLSPPLHAQSSLEYDIVLTGGRVIDPETKLDAI